MSRRTDKKRLKKINEAQAAAPKAQEEHYTLYIQYQDQEYDAALLAARIREKCAAEGMDASDLKIYVKPEDRKAYYTCSGQSSFIEL